MDPLLYIPPENQNQMDTITLNDALAVCIDSLTLAEHAFKHCETESLRSVFEGLVRTKEQLVVELKKTIREERVTPTKNGTLTGDLRRWYISAKELFSKDVDQVLLNQLYEYEVRNMQMLQQAIMQCQENEKVDKLIFAKRLIEMHVDTLSTLLEKQ